MDRRSAYVVPAPLNTSSDRRQASSPAESFASFPNAAKEPPMTALVYAVPDTAETIDRDPLEALARGDEAAWRSTVRRFEGMVRSTARSVLRNDADVDEAVQRTWIQLLRSAARIKDQRCLPGWLATTARREALSVLRSQQRAIPSEDVADRVAPDDRDLGAALMSRELRRELDRAVDTLPDSQRTVVRALLREPESYDALSRELGIPRGSLGPLRGRAVRALRAQLEPSLR
jgi:RNA polymerase sigma factor (sigma-70 family)